MAANRRENPSVPFTSAVVSTHVHATEDEEKVLKAIKDVVQDADFEIIPLSGHHGNPILLIKAKVGRKGIQKWWNHLYEKLDSSSKEKLLREVGLKIDETCFLYLRFDKQNASLEKLSLSDGDDVIRLKLKVSAFPSKPEVAARNVVSYLKRSRS